MRRSRCWQGSWVTVTILGNPGRHSGQGPAQHSHPPGPTGKGHRLTHPKAHRPHWSPAAHACPVHKHITHASCCGPFPVPFLWAQFLPYHGGHVCTPELTA